MKTREIDAVAADLPVQPTTAAASQPTFRAGATERTIVSPSQSALAAVRDSGRIRIGAGMLRV
jgi:hypothetical protein